MHLVMTVIGAAGQIVSDFYGFLPFLIPAAELALLCWIGRILKKELAIQSGKRTDFSPADGTKIWIIIGLSFLIPSFLFLFLAGTGDLSQMRLMECLKLWFFTYLKYGLMVTVIGFGTLYGHRKNDPQE